MTRHLHVTCAIIERDGRVLAAQRRGGGSMAFKWEFPGGKIRPGESPEACLHRELMEEMGLRVDVKRPLDPARTATRRSPYPVPFVCTIAGRARAERAPACCRGTADPDWAEADRR